MNTIERGGPSGARPLKSANLRHPVSNQQAGSPTQRSSQRKTLTLFIEPCDVTLTSSALESNNHRVACLITTVNRRCGSDKLMQPGCAKLARVGSGGKRNKAP